MSILLKFGSMGQPSRDKLWETLISIHLPPSYFLWWIVHSLRTCSIKDDAPTASCHIHFYMFVLIQTTEVTFPSFPAVKYVLFFGKYFQVHKPKKNTKKKPHKHSEGLPFVEWKSKSPTALIGCFCFMSHTSHLMYYLLQKYYYCLQLPFNCVSTAFSVLCVAFLTKYSTFCQLFLRNFPLSWGFGKFVSKCCGIFGNHCLLSL